MSGFQVMVAEDRLVDYIHGGSTCRFDFAHTRRWPKMIANAIGPAEAPCRDDFLVEDTFASKSGKVAMSHVPLTRNGAEFQIGRHERSSK
jgi:hypothetical protein